MKTSLARFCAFCKSTRMVYSKKHVSLIDAFLALATSLLLSFIVWQEFDPRLVIFFALGLGLAEVFIIFRWRLSIACPHCGFDPVLYKKSPQKAAARAKQHLDARRANPLSAFQAPLNLPVIVKKPEASAQDHKVVSPTKAGKPAAAPAKKTNRPPTPGAMR